MTLASLIFAVTVTLGTLGPVTGLIEWEMARTDGTVVETRMGSRGVAESWEVPRGYAIQWHYREIDPGTGEPGLWSPWTPAAAYDPLSGDSNFDCQVGGKDYAMLGMFWGVSCE